MGEKPWKPNQVWQIPDSVKSFNSQIHLSSTIKIWLSPIPQTIQLEWVNLVTPHDSLKESFFVFQIQSSILPNWLLISLGGSRRLPKIINGHTDTDFFAHGTCISQQSGGNAIFHKPETGV